MSTADESAYSSPLIAAELAEYNARRAQHWVIGAHGAMRQPMAAEACTDCGPEQRQRRTWPWWAAALPYCVLVVAFFTAGWIIFALPSSETARVLALLIVAPLALIAAVALLARWLH